MDSNSYSPLEIWLLAARPKTLPAAVSPVVVGSGVAFYSGSFAPGPALAAFLGALLLQVGANLANDVFDYKRGADIEGRLGPLRVTQAGLLSPQQVLAGMWFCFGLAALLGIYLVFAAGWQVVLIGLAAILAAIAYTGGPFPLGYYGLGDMTVFLFFGPVAVCGTYFVQTGHVSSLALWSSLPMGFLITAILVVNNLRDINTDRVAGKRTLAVRIGAPASRLEYIILIVGAFLVPVILVVLRIAPAGSLLSWLAIPSAVTMIRFVVQSEGKVLNKALADTGRFTLVYALLYALGLIASPFLLDLLR